MNDIDVGTAHGVVMDAAGWETAHACLRVLRNRHGDLIFRYDPEMCDCETRTAEPLPTMVLSVFATREEAVSAAWAAQQHFHHLMRAGAL